MHNIDKPKCEASDCQKRVSPKAIFCRDCFMLASPGERRNWLVAFPYPTEYAVAMKLGYEDQRRAIEQMRKGIAFAKTQMLLFAYTGEEK